MRRAEGQRGYIFLETLAAGLALLALSACFFLFAHSLKAQLADSCRQRAVFLARTQFAAAQAEAARGTLRQGDYPWQGKAEDLQEPGTVFAVQTSVDGREGSGEENVYQVRVQVKWQGKITEGQLELERDVVNHG